MAKAQRHAQAAGERRLEAEIQRLREEVRARLPMVVAAAAQQAAATLPPSWHGVVGRTAPAVERKQQGAGREEKQEPDGDQQPHEGHEEEDEEEEEAKASPSTAAAATTTTVRVLEECRREHAALRAELAALRRMGFYHAQASSPPAPSLAASTCRPPRYFPPSLLTAARGGAHPALYPTYYPYYYHPARPSYRVSPPSTWALGLEEDGWLDAGYRSPAAVFYDRY